jgi:hypothetical protein
MPGLWPVIWFLSGCGRGVVPGMPGCAPAPTVPECSSFRVAGVVRADQADAGNAHSRCQQVRNASFHGQLVLMARVRCRAWQASRAGRCRPPRSRSRRLRVDHGLDTTAGSTGHRDPVSGGGPGVPGAARLRAFSWRHRARPVAVRAPQRPVLRGHARHFVPAITSPPGFRTGSPVIPAGTHTRPVPPQSRH